MIAPSSPTEELPYHPGTWRRQRMAFGRFPPAGTSVAPKQGRHALRPQSPEWCLICDYVWALDRRSCITVHLDSVRVSDFSFRPFLEDAVLGSP